MKIKIIAIVLALVCLAGILTACEHSTKFVENGIKYWEWQGEVIVEGFANEENNIKDLVIKGTVDYSPKYYMWAINQNAFENSEIESLTIEYYKAESNPYYSDGYGDLTFVDIRDCAFKNCKRLKTVSFPYGMTTIGEQAFYGCASLKAISFPFCLDTIGNEAFANCTSLNEIRIDENLQRLGTGAFGNCANNLTVYLKCNPPETDGEIFSPDAAVKLIVPDNLLTTYQNSEFWSRYTITTI